VLDVRYFAHVHIHVLFDEKGLDRLDILVLAQVVVVVVIDGLACVASR